MSAAVITALPYRRVLLTGGSGFVGGYLAPALAAATPGARRILIRGPGRSGKCPGYEAAEADISDHASVEAIVRDLRPDLVVHLAAQSSVAASRGAGEATWQVNFGGSFALASACARMTPEVVFLFASSAEVYGASFRDGPVDEDTALRPQNVYSRSKAAAEWVLDDLLPPQAQLIVARAFNHTGPGQDERFVLPSFAAQIARIEAGLQSPIMKVGNLDVSRDFLDVRDVCDAYLRLIADGQSMPNRSVFNVSSGAARPIRELLDMLKAKAICNFDVCIDLARLRSSDIPIAVGCNHRLESVTQWRPLRKLEETTADLLECARQSLK